MSRYMTKHLVYRGKICGVLNPHGVTKEEIAGLKSLYPKDQEYEYKYSRSWDSEKLVRVTTKEAADYINNKRWREREGFAGLGT